MQDNWWAPPPDPRQGSPPLDPAHLPPSTQNTAQPNLSPRPCAGLRLKLRVGLPTLSALTPVPPSGEGRATADGWADDPNFLEIKAHSRSQPRARRRPFSFGPGFRSKTPPNVGDPSPTLHTQGAFCARCTKSFWLPAHPSAVTRPSPVRGTGVRLTGGAGPPGARISDLNPEYYGVQGW